MKESIKNLESKIKNFYTKDKINFYILFVILLIGSFLRLYQIDKYMTFLGDEGRDVIVVRRLLVDFDPILVGPGTSIGNMYLGPLYYYMMAPALLLANFSPVGPAVMVALLGIFTIFFIWHVAREWFGGKGKQGEIAAIVAAALFSVSPVVIIYSRSSWNPNIMPFFALLSIYSIWRVWQFFEWKWLIILGISMAFVLQSHYIGLILIPVIVFFWSLTLVEQWLTKSKKGQIIDTNFVRKSLIGFVCFFILMSPLLIFDARHGWRNFQAMKVFFTQRQTTVSARPWTAIPKSGEILQDIFTTIAAAGNKTLGGFLAGIFLISFIWFLTRVLQNVHSSKKSEKPWVSRILQSIRERSIAPFTIIFVWIILSLFGFGVYKQHVYSHYYGFLYPAPFLLIGGLSATMWNKLGKFVHLFIVLFILGLFLVNLFETPIKYPPNRQLERTRQVSEKIIVEARNEKFNLAVIAERNYEGAYQYFLEKENAPIVMIDPQRADDTVAEQLFVVCELPENECDPTHNEKAEIANFGWSKIDNQWNVAGTILYKLVHNTN